MISVVKMTIINSNTTNVKVKQNVKAENETAMTNSNTTNVKVKH